MISLLYQIAGMALNGILKKGEREEAERRLTELNDKKFKTIFGLLYKVNEKVDLFAKYNVEELFECRILSVDENHRGKGLANILMADCVETAKNAGFKVSFTRIACPRMRGGVSPIYRERRNDAFRKYRGRTLSRAY